MGAYPARPLVNVGSPKPGVQKSLQNSSRSVAQTELLHISMQSRLYQPLQHYLFRGLSFRAPLACALLYLLPLIKRAFDSRSAFRE